MTPYIDFSNCICMNMFNAYKNLKFGEKYPVRNFRGSKTDEN